MQWLRSRSRPSAVHHFVDGLFAHLREDHLPDLTHLEAARRGHLAHQFRPALFIHFRGVALDHFHLGASGRKRFFARRLRCSARENAPVFGIGSVGEKRRRRGIPACPRARAPQRPRHRRKKRPWDLWGRPACASCRRQRREWSANSRWWPAGLKRSPVPSEMTRRRSPHQRFPRSLRPACAAEPPKWRV